MNGAWAVVAAALGSAALTLLGAFWLEQWRLGRAARAADTDRLREACAQMEGHAFSFTHRALHLYLHHRKPLDPMELADWLAVDLTPMFEAQGVIEITADEDLVRAASGLIVAAMGLSGKASSVTSGSPGPGASIWARSAARFRALVPLRWDPEVEEAIHQAVRTLGRELRGFARVTREHLGVNDPDAVIRAFPELFAEAAATDPEVDEEQVADTAQAGQVHAG